MRKSITTEALVLACTDVGEQDRILTFLTPERGLLKAAATSARNLKKGRAAPLDLFVKTRLTINIPGKEGKLKRITSAEIISPFLSIRSDYGRLCAASYIAQTVAHCIQEDDPSPGTWDLVMFCLRSLDDGFPPLSVLLPFEIILLKEIGILPELFKCVECSREVGGEAYMDARKGGIIHSRCSSMECGPILSGGDMAVLRYLSTREIAAVLKLTVKEDDTGRLFDIVHSFLVHHLGYEARALQMLRK